MLPEGASSALIRASVSICLTLHRGGSWDHVAGLLLNSSHDCRHHMVSPRVRVRVQLLHSCRHPSVRTHQPASKPLQQLVGVCSPADHHFWPLARAMTPLPLRAVRRRRRRCCCAGRPSQARKQALLQRWEPRGVLQQSLGCCGCSGGVAQPPRPCRRLVLRRTARLLLLLWLRQWRLRLRLWRLRLLLLLLRLLQPQLLLLLVLSCGEHGHALRLVQLQLLGSCVAAADHRVLQEGSCQAGKGVAARARVGVPAQNQRMRSTDLMRRLLRGRMARRMSLATGRHARQQDAATCVGQARPAPPRPHAACARPQRATPATHLTACAVPRTASANASSVVYAPASARSATSFKLMGGRGSALHGQRI